MRPLAAILALCIVAAPCHAAPPSALAAFVATPQHRAAILAKAPQTTSWFLRGCETANFEPLPGMKLWRTPEFDASGQPTSGEWVERVRASGCGISRTLNVDNVVGPGGSVTLRDLVPGTSRASPALQDEARLKVSKVETMFHGPGCKDDYIDDTAAIGRHADDDAPAWSERWTVRVCGRSVVVLVDYAILYAGDDIRARRITPRYPNELARPATTF